ncbi:MAG: DUF6785 family protein [Armatimonadia bacterium]
MRAASSVREAFVGRPAGEAVSVLIMAQSEHLAQHDPQPEAPLQRAITPRACLLALLLLVVANIWMMYAELVTLSAQVTMSVPPIPALMGLIVLLAVRPLGKWLRLRRGELLVVYVFLTLSVALTSGGALREFMPEMTALQYFATPENGWGDYVQYQPDWLVPKDPEVIRAYYEGSEAGVPWRAWVGTLAAWSGFFVLLLGTLLCMALLFHDEWAKREKLAFQITELPLAMTAPAGQTTRIPQLWRDPLMWIGFGLAALHNGLNILHAFNPAIPALGFSYGFEKIFTERPWKVLGEVTIFHRPEVLGFAYLMPQDVVVSSLIFYALVLVEGIAALSFGYDIPRFPHFESQSAGAFIGFALILIYLSRKHLWEAIRGAADPQTPLLRRAAVWGLGLGLVGMYAFWQAAGMASVTILIYFGVLLLMALTYARIRAQAGLPEQWAFPVSQAHFMPMAFIGSKVYRYAGGVQNLSVYGTAWFMTRGYLPNLSAYHFEGLHIAQEGGVRRREMVGTLVAAMVLGLVVSFAVQLYAGYGYGASFLEGGTSGGGMRVADARFGFSQLKDAATVGIKPLPTEAGAAVYGLLMTVALTVVRTYFARFPLSHLGFIIGTTRGYRVWGGLFFAAIIKAIAVRLGGVGLYRRLIPAAIGLVLGHFVLAGGVWSIAAMFGGDAFRSYQVWFG